MLEIFVWTDEKQPLYFEDEISAMGFVLPEIECVKPERRWSSAFDADVVAGLGQRPGADDR